MANDDLIYRNRLVTMLNEQKQCEGFPDPWYEGYNTGLETAITISEHMPSIDATPTIHAEWVKENDRVNHWHCSNCDNAFGQVVYFYKFCPFCGASMTVKDQTNL